MLTIANPLNITETGLIQSEMDYVGSVINVGWAPVSSGAEITRTVTSGAIPGGEDGFTNTTIQGDTTILHADILISFPFAEQDYLNIHELGHALGLAHVTDTSDPTVSVMLPGSVSDTYLKSYLDTLHTYGTEDVATLVSMYGSADQTITGTSGNDGVNALGGNDTVFGQTGDDSINGNQGNDFIFGGQGNDTARGGQGNDTLSADKGNDQIWGDLGSDVFLFTGSGTGNDTVIDFTQGQDHVQLSGTIYALWNGVHNHLTQVGSDSVLTFSDTGNTLTLHGVTASALSASDFIFS